MSGHMSVEGMKAMCGGRHERALRDAELRRLLREAAFPGRPGARARLLVRLGERLICLGQGLKARYRPAAR